MKIAAWSGPRNISTAMMRAWENRSDCVVSDEPLYAAWLEASGADHPGRDEVIAAGETDWQRVTGYLSGPNPDGSALWYQKHMCHHLIEGLDMSWTDSMQHVFLIREPEAVVASYVKARGTEEVTPQDVGLPQQLALYEWISRRQGKSPPVIDSQAFLQDPATQLHALCERMGIGFDDAMLSWPAGPRATDGVWARYWYDAVWRSTGFGAPARHRPELDGRPAAVARICRPLYEALLEHRLQS
ncbi:MAG: HAD family hydrolase [Wenzhouxiangella sp.]|nr:MAG: HAD family hydrolase [Wenzhouxiangella sp.]